MHLSADHITLDFPLAQAAHSRASAGAAPLGGRLHGQGRSTFVRALDDVSFHLEIGDRLALVGHNGSGKSTLLRVLAGIYHPDRGHVSSSSHVSGIFNMSLGFRQEATGYRNLVIKGLMAGRSRAEIEAALPEIAEFTGLGPYLDMPLHTYSQGMAMRLAFAATTAFSNDILVMDECIGAGDAGFQEKIIARMNDFLHASTIVVVASHSASLLRRLANKAIWLEQGQVRRMGGPEVIDEYEAAISVVELAPPLRAQVDARRGLWVAREGLDAPHLLWNLPGNVEGLQLRVHTSGQGLTVVRAAVARCGAWPLAPWVQAGMRFEIARPNEEPVAAYVADAA